MRRIALATAAVLALALAANTSAGVASPHARSSAAHFLETLTVGAEQAPVTSKVSLSSKKTYTLKLSGATTTTLREVGTPPVSPWVERWDSLYCYESPAVSLFTGGPLSGCSPPYGPLPNSGLSVVKPTPGHLQQVGALTYPPFSQGHSYSVRFKPRASGRLTLVNQPFYFHKVQVNSPNYLGSTGSYTVKIYGPGARKKKKRKKRKKRVNGCPASTSSNAGARAAGSCHWVVDFTVTQKGLPLDSIPDPADGFVDAETVAIGKVFFNAKPKRGRVSSGRPAGILTHTDTYRTPLNPFLFEEGVTKVKPLTATYQITSGEARIELTGIVTEVSGVVYSYDYYDHTLAAGDNARVALVSEPPNDDRLRLQMLCSACEKSKVTGNHYHQFVTGAEDKLRVRISAPRQL